jgi:hypothetical protein
MKIRTVTAALLLMATIVRAQETDPRLTGPMPPDPVTVNRVAGPLTPATLAVWQLTSSPSDFLWRILQASETLTTPQLRTLALDLLRVRRFEDADSPQDWLFLSALADREPAAAAREVLGIADWEDRDDNIDDSDSDVESLGVLFWRKLADQDFPAALAIAGNLPDGETSELFFSQLGSEPWPGSTGFSPGQAVEWMKLAKGAGNPNFAYQFAGTLAGRLLNASGPETAHLFVDQLPAGPVRNEIQRALDGLKSTSNPIPSDRPEPPPIPMDARLENLRKLDSTESDSPFPFSLYRAVRALTPPEARELASLTPEAYRPAGWLYWLLVKQAGQDAPADGTLPAVDPPRSLVPFEGMNPPVLYRPEAAQIRSLLHRRKYEAALAAAGDFKKSLALSQHRDPCQDILQIWALEEFPAALAFASKEKNQDLRDSYFDSLTWAIHRLPYADVLPYLDPAILGEMDQSIGPWWVFLPFEDRTAGFRYFEKHKTDRKIREAAECFCDIAVRFEPARAIALQREIPSEDGLQGPASGLATHWPDRIGELLKPEDGKEAWKAVAKKLAYSHPEKIVALLEAQPFQEAWDEAGSHLRNRPDLMKVITRRMSRSAVRALPGVKEVSGKDNHPQLIGPMPPDPITVNRVAGPITPASLSVWQRTSSPSDFLWRMLKATKSLSTPQLRTLTLDLLRVRRFRDEDYQQDWLMLSALADREPTAAVQEVLGIADWEDRDENIGDYDSDVENIGALFWRHLADRDFPTALAIAAKLQGRETIGQFLTHHWLTEATRFSPAQAAEVVKLAAKLENDNDAAYLARDFVREMAAQSKSQAARALVELLPDGVIRQEGAKTLADAEMDPEPAPAPSAPPLEMSDARLRSLQELDSKDQFRPFPFPLFRAIRALPPAEAQELAAQFPQTASTEGGWLAWLLAMEAREGDQPATALPSVPLPPSNSYQNGSDPDTPEFRKIRAILAQAAAGKYKAALAAAAAFKTGPHPAEQELPNPSHDVMTIWALQDFPAAIAYVTREKDEAKRRSYIPALNLAIPRLPCANVLPHIPPTEFFWGELSLDPWRHFIAFEDREAGFRYFAKHKDVLKGEAGEFLATAVRLDPVRAVALARKRGSELNGTAWGLALHWPDRIHELLRPEDGKEVWEAVALCLAEHNPYETIAVLEGQPFQEPWDQAGSQLRKLPELMKTILPRMSPGAQERARQDQ